jgi:hypothetical protein
VEGREGNEKVREMQFGSSGCCPDLGAGWGDLVPAPHKNYGRLGYMAETVLQFFVSGEISFVYRNMTWNTF